MKIIIAGAGTVGRHVAELLQQEQHDVSVVELSPERLSEFDDLDLQTVEGSATNPEVLRKAGIGEARLFLGLTDHDETNLLASMTSRQLGARKAIARVRQPHYLVGPARDPHSNLAQPKRIPYRSLLGIDMIVSPEWLAALEIVQHINQPAAVAIENFAGGRLQMRQFCMNADHAFTGLSLAALRPHLPDDMLIVLIGRGDELIVPWGSLTLEAGDRVTALGFPDSVEKFGETFIAEEQEEPIKSIFIMGGGVKGFMLAQMLDQHKQYNVTLLEVDRNRCDFLSDHLQRTTVMHGDGTRLPLLKELRVQQADLFIGSTGHDEQNLMSCLQAKSLGVKRLYTIMNRPDYVTTVEQFGIDLAVSPREIIGNRVRAMVQRGEVRHLSLFEDGRAAIMEYVAQSRTKIVEQPLKELKLPHGVLIASLLRNGEPMVPTGDTRIQPDDVVVVLTLAENFEQVERFFGHRREP
ncbi:Trk system potassium transporter TrkA [Candidatus Sumerlaeota bacterium]|nr:Trk system potassium transporter TrkA [Candidatus Sumerlaeota bacterium]